jgi:RimJ/RimL family protein N-acetyltransferase
MTAPTLGPRILRGRFVSLEPVTGAHREGLRAAAAGQPEEFRYMPLSAAGDGFDAWWDDLNNDATKRARIVLAVRRLADDAIVGSTSYGNIVPEHARAEIGWTWYAKSAQGTAVNPEAKLLLFANAFETAGYRRVELKTDARNARSRAAIRKLGATEEGIFRSHMWLPDGHRRDTAYYSVIAEEWPKVKAGLEERLSAFAPLRTKGIER